MKKIDIEKLPYRPCVGIALFNHAGRVWVGCRSDKDAEGEGEGHWWQMPQGGLDKGEDPYQAALRELYEETGYVCKALKHLGTGRIMMNRHNCREFAFLGTGAVGDPKFEGTKEFEVVLLTLADFKELVLSGQFEQFAALTLLVLADWKLGSQFVRQS